MEQVRLPFAFATTVAARRRSTPVEAGGSHHRPHFHACYQEHAAVFAIDTLECLGGDLPISQRRLVEAWAEIHRPELEQDWGLLQSGQPPLKIEPLR